MTPLEEKINGLADKQTEHGQKLDKIFTAITGDQMGNKGVIPRLDEQEKHIKELQEKDKKRWWFIVGSATGGSLIGTFGGPAAKAFVAKVISAMMFLK